ncbi:hypothetical protein M2H08_18360, partial [Vibrio vulnificus]|nr:hypothetical protein [Vibrio vulnificus]
LSGCNRSFARKLIGWSMTLSPDFKLTGKALSIAYYHCLVRVFVTQEKPDACFITVLSKYLVV